MSQKSPEYYSRLKGAKHCAFRDKPCSNECAAMSESTLHGLHYIYCSRLKAYVYDEEVTK